MLIFVLLGGQMPWCSNRRRIQQIISAIQNSKRPDDDIEWDNSIIPADLIHLMKRCWNQDPNARPSTNQITDVLNHVIEIRETTTTSDNTINTNGNSNFDNVAIVDQVLATTKKPDFKENILGTAI